MNTKLNDAVFDFLPILETERLILRAFEKEDAEALWRIKNDNRVMEFVDIPKPKTVEDSHKQIEEMEERFKKKNGISWVIVEKKSNRFIGYIGLWRLIREHLRAEIGYSLNVEFWRNGIMSEAMKRVLNFGFSELKIHSVEANVNTKNVRSIRLLEKFGFQKEAHFRENYFFDGEFLDSIIYCLLEQG